MRVGHPGCRVRSKPLRLRGVVESLRIAGTPCVGGVCWGVMDPILCLRRPSS